MILCGIDELIVSPEEMNTRTAAYGQNTVALFSKHCRNTPNQIALEHDGNTLTYRELDALSNFYALKFTALQLLPRQSIALFSQRSIHVIAAMLGCLKCGVPFVPIDVSLPHQRIQYMIDDARVALVLSDSQSDACVRQLVKNSAVVIWQLSTSLDIDTLPAANSDFDIAGKTDVASPSPCAYIMYTSGSTGQPKGVAISQAALAHYCEADAQVYTLSNTDRTLQFATLSFDICIEEIFPPLSTGGTVILRPTLRSNAQIELSDIIERCNVTALHLATGYWHEWVDLMSSANAFVPLSLRLMVVTGEKVSPRHYTRWQQLSRHETLWANAYGPTEATVSATVFVPPNDWQGLSMPIGKALPGYSTYILDEQRRQVPKGRTGELYIGGRALAEGYVNQPELTRNAFIKDPFSNDDSDRLYHTGDLARLLDDGNIDYAGRIDHQLKVDSYRIEPGEIENRINEQEDVLESLVSAETIGDRQHLVAYIAIDGPMNIGESESTAYRIRKALEALLPSYMVPTRYMLLPELPKTLNGKINRTALPPATTALTGRNATTVIATTTTEQILCEIWQDVLATPNVSTHDSFLSLGGNSLMAVRAIAHIQKRLKFTISTRDFFFLDTIVLLAGHMEGRKIPRLIPPVETFFINTRQRQLYGVTQAPSPDNDNGLGILLVPPLGNEQRRCQRPFRTVMQQVAREGFRLTRFDWQGTGNSSGRASSINDLAIWEEDLHDATNHLSKSVDEVHIISVRMGALITAGLNLQSMPVAGHYMWDPVFAGRQWLTEMQHLQQGILADTYRFLFKRKIRTDGFHEFAGLTINPSLYRQLHESDLASALNSKPTAAAMHVLTSDDSAQWKQLPEHINVHTGCEPNAWNNPRATTVNMNINRAARLSLALIKADTAAIAACA